MMACSDPDDCAEIEARHRPATGLLADGGASRGNLLSGDADHAHPDGQPDQRREAREPRLSRVLRQRLQRHPRARPLPLGGGARVVAALRAEPPRRAAARASRRRLRVHARGDVRRSCAT